jgi:hypothetical protein
LFLASFISYPKKHCFLFNSFFLFNSLIPPPFHAQILERSAIYKSASIGDIDMDGLKEIVVGVDEGTDVDPSRVHCFKPDGTECPGFPIGLSRFGYRSKAVLADVEGNGYLDIIIGKEAEELSVIRHDGAYLPGYPSAYGARGLSVGDLDADGDLDMISPGGHWPYYIRGFDILTGAMLPNFPFMDPNNQFFFGMGGAAANICDINGGSEPEIVAGSGTQASVPDGRLFAFDLYGQIATGFPSLILPHRWLNSTCSISDLNGDGTTDICCGSENDESTVPRSSTVYCWTTGYPYNLDNVDWAMDEFDLGHTGRWRRLYHINKTSSQLSVASSQCQENPCYLPADGSLIPVIVTAVREHGGANPAGQDVRYSRTLGCGEYFGPVIDNGDGTYVRMLRAPWGECATDIHAWVNEFKLEDCQTIQFVSAPGAVPKPVPDGKWVAGQAMRASKLAGDGTTVHITWDVSACPDPIYHVYSGPLSAVASYGYDRWECSIGASGTVNISLDAADAFFLVIPANGAVEGSHGRTGPGAERPAAGVGHCGVTSKDASGNCP